MSLTRLIRDQLAANHRIAAAVIEVLAESGEAALRARALRALGEEAPAIHQVGRWIALKRMTAMLEAAELPRHRARRVGQRLVGPSGVGFALCYSGLTTPEQAYRHVDDLLARETGSGRYSTALLANRYGRIVFDPAPNDADARDIWPAELGPAVCGMREGMLEAVPTLFGLLPATVRETQCAFEGAENCEFEVRWSHMPRRGLLAGAGLGALLGAGLVTASGLAVWALAIGIPLFALLGAAAGRAVDLAQQLEAVGGARRGHLALLEQFDSGLAERMDDLARLGEPATSSDRPLCQGEGLVPISQAGRSRSSAGAVMADAVGQATGDLQRAAAALGTELSNLTASMAKGQPAPTEWGQGLGSCALQSRRIEEAAAVLTRAVGGCGERQEHEIKELVEGALKRFRSGLSVEFSVDTELEEGLPPIACDAGQIEYVVQQLLANARSASAGDPQAKVRLVLRGAPGGIELMVEDEGECLEADTIDRIFDPFVEDAPSQSGPAQSLPACLRIVENHGGEFAVQPVGDRGNRISLVLPAQPPA